MSYLLSLLILLFFTYSFIGWIHEVIYRLITERRFHTTGFLTMPILPIYGTGAIIILFLVEPYIHNPFLVFLFSVLISSFLEFFTHLILDKVFHIKLWDYSKKRFNLQGRVCLENSLGFGALALLLVYVLHPLILMGFDKLPHEVVIVLAIVLSSLTIIDFANSLVSLIRVRASKIRGTFKDIETHILNELASAVDPKTNKQRRLRARRAFLRLHKFNIQRLTGAYPDAHRR